MNKKLDILFINSMFLCLQAPHQNKTKQKMHGCLVNNANSQQIANDNSKFFPHRKTYKQSNIQANIQLSLITMFYSYKVSPKTCSSKLDYKWI